MLLEALREEVTGELELEGELDTALPLRLLGVDSLMSVNLANRLEASLGLKVPIATLVRGPNLEDLADELLAQFAESPGSPEPAPGQPAASRSAPPPRPERRGEWLVCPRPNRTAAVRLFCFNYAGGGASPFQPWAARLSPSIELLIVEPPGRGSRIHESPVTRLDTLLDRLMPEMRPYLDRPCAFFGHCLGALTLYETARRLLGNGFPDLLRIFVSGARTPNRIAATGSFEEELLGRMLADPGFDALRPFHEQPDETFASMLRQFNIWATDDLLEQRELRTLLLPAIRADFEMAATYRFTPQTPWTVPITCFAGLDDPYVTREQAMEWNRHTSTEFRMHLRHGNHFLVVEDRDFIVATINAELGSAPGPEPRS
jgi:surfactin synthase thioesterase subunit/acyl carrier protein